MNKCFSLIRTFGKAFLLILLALMASGCLPALPTDIPPQGTPSPVPTSTLPLPTPIATRPAYQPGELVDYTAQTGDNLEALAARFNTSIQEIRAANPIIPDTATTMPPGMPMKIPIYYRPLWGTSYQIIPDSQFVDGPAAVGFDTVKFVDQQPGWLKNHVETIGSSNRRGGEIINIVAQNYSISPRLLLALAEYQTGALTQPTQKDPGDPYPFGINDYHYASFYGQLSHIADMLDNSYYAYRAGKLLSFEHLDGRLERPDPWQNAATVSLQYYYSRLLDGEDYTRAVSSVGIAKTFQTLFGDPWVDAKPHIPGSLEQPALRLPFEPGLWWAYTGGPHNSWGDEMDPLSAIDFAPPSVASGCIPADQWATAIADGTVVRTGVGIVVLDLDGDNDERTGWDIFYLHLEAGTTPPLGTHLKAGERIGKPSCEGGHATGTHVHIARKYNGEWILANGVLAWNLEGWVTHTGTVPYQGTLTRGGRTVVACTCSDQNSQLESEMASAASP